MDRMALVLAVAAVTYATRVSGFYLGRQAVPRTLDRFLDYVPVTAFAALVVPGIDAGGGEMLPHLIGLGAAALAGIRFKQLWVVIVVGMGAYWVVGAVGLSST
jgi:branched-subunit amino acid transport protein